ncbi:MAG: Methionyl-tRNA formyltransferase [Planctomycetota bacterium]
MRIVMMGTGRFAVPTLRKLAASSHQLICLVTRPDVKGRGTPPPNPMRETAEHLQLPIIDPISVNSPEAIDRLRSMAADLFVVCDYGQILKSETLAITPLGGINLHGSLLPQYRGAAPIQRAMLAGETTSGVAVIHMTPRLDAGPILESLAVPIDPQENAEELETRLAELGAPLVLAAIDRLAAWDRQSPIGTPQDPLRASKAPRLSKSEGLVDWRKSAREIAFQVRAFKPWPTTYTYWHRDGHPPMRLILDKVAAGSNESLPATTSAKPGEIVMVARDRVLIGTGDGLLELVQVQPSGKRTMTIEEFLRGYPMAVGQLLGSEDKPN